MIKVIDFYSDFKSNSICPRKLSILSVTAILPQNLGLAQGELGFFSSVTVEGSSGFSSSFGRFPRNSMRIEGEVARKSEKMSGDDREPARSESGACLSHEGGVYIRGGVLCGPG